MEAFQAPSGTPYFCMLSWVAAGNRNHTATVTVATIAAPNPEPRIARRPGGVPEMAAVVVESVTRVRLVDLVSLWEWDRPVGRLIGPRGDPAALRVLLAQWTLRRGAGPREASRGRRR